MKKGVLSMKDALEVGVIIEVTDIDDLDEVLGATTRMDIRNVYTNLRQGSVNHLAASRPSSRGPEPFTNFFPRRPGTSGGSLPCRQPPIPPPSSFRAAPPDAGSGGAGTGNGGRGGGRAAR